MDHRAELDRLSERVRKLELQSDKNSYDSQRALDYATEVSVELIRVTADLNKLVSTTSAALWSYLALKGLCTIGDSDLYDKAFALAVSEVDQAYEQQVHEGMVDMSEGQRDLLKKAMGME